MARIFWDTNLFIYLFEHNTEWSSRVIEFRQRMLARNDELLTSYLTVGEALTKPREAGNTVVHKSYLDFFMNGPVKLVKLIPFELEAAKRYADIRSRERIRPADAIQWLVRLPLRLTCSSRMKIGFQKRRFPASHLSQG